MGNWPTRAEKLKQFKDRILEDLEVETDEGLIVHLKGGGSINFEVLVDCFIRTRKFTLYSLTDRIHDADKIDRNSVFKMIREELNDIDNESSPT